MKKGDILELDIVDINNLGCGVARYGEGGKVVFVKGAVTGDRVRAAVIKDNKSFSVARLCEIITPSAFRDEQDFCDTALSCGGCVYRHITYEHEKEIKQGTVKSAFVKAGLPEVTVLPTLSTQKIKGYRNKAQYPVANTKNGMISGFYASKTHNIVPVRDCSIQYPAFAEITRAVCAICDKYGIWAYEETTGEGLLRHIYLRVAEVSGEIMLCLVINGVELPNEKEITDELTARFPSIVSLMVNKNTQNTNVVLGKEYRTLWGRDYIEDTLCGLRFRITAPSFYQVNREGAELIYGLAARLAELDGTQNVADLYCGTGTIGLSVASKAKSLVGIEIVSSAVECAKQNAEFNGIDNAKFFCADAGDADTILACMGGVRPDVVMIDPPRKGSTKELVDCLAQLDVPKIVYVSCDPTTLARDCAWFREKGYEIGEVQPVDMFPRTGHVETVVCLSRKTTHEMKLYASPFEKIKSGAKNIELRLFDEKRQKIKIGDNIIFTNTVNGEKMCATVKKLHQFGSFEELYKSLPLLQCGYTVDDVDTAHPSDMEQYYSAEKQKKYGVVGIELFPPKRITDESVVCLTRGLDVDMRR